MANLLEETQIVLARRGRTFGDLIAAIGNDFQFPISSFCALADTEYDEGYGAPEVALDLVLIGNGFWLERHQYDGSEWWEYKEMPRYDDLPIHIPKALTIAQAKRNGEDCHLGRETLDRLNRKALTEEIKYEKIVKTIKAGKGKEV